MKRLVNKERNISEVVSGIVWADFTNIAKDVSSPALDFLLD